MSDELGSSCLDRIIVRPSLVWAQWGRWIAAILVVLVTVWAQVVAFPPYEVPEAAFFFAIPILGWLYWAQPTGKVTLVVGLMSGWISWGCLLRWLHHFPEQVGVAYPNVLGWGAVVLLSGVVALFWVVWVFFARWLLSVERCRHLAWRVWALLALAGGWCLLEWLRTWIFTGFPWLPLSSSQWERPMMLQIAAYTGAWGISFVLILMNGGVVFYLRHLLTTQRRPWWRRFSVEFYLSFGGLLILLSAGLWDPYYGASERAFSGGFIQPAVQPKERWDESYATQVLSDYERVCSYAVWDGAEVILWPEASIPYPAPGDPWAEDWLSSLAHRLRIPILMGNLASEREGGSIEARQWYNAVIAIDPEEGIADRFYQKQHLVPFGEYVPRWIPFLDKVVPLDGYFTEGEGPIVLELRINGKDWRFGPLVCYEDLFPQLARQYIAEHIDVFFVATNDAWYGREGAAYQHASHSVLRAVETRRPVLRAGNEGWSGWIDERGQIRAVLIGGEGTVYFQGANAIDIYVDPRYYGRESLYVQWGDWWISVSFGLVLIAVGYGLLLSRRSGACVC